MLYRLDVDRLQIEYSSLHIFCCRENPYFFFLFYFFFLNLTLCNWSLFAELCLEKLTVRSTGPMTAACFLPILTSAPKLSSLHFTGIHLSQQFFHTLTGTLTNNHFRLLKNATYFCHACKKEVHFNVTLLYITYITLLPWY